ncbi:MAG: acyl phosphate:glycerol-3-phosphate acyltransferase [Clostridiales bacterium]|jgi:glycerol-3-phosphate acyltransferase PlsY|nr:acyl phosphate:glycerol-3-phosphate acyltransferase [Clostridiales bacterium]MDN5282525.1 acyl phosphate:glycerol-3-phosphate acyltransferase [Candidatus Ozemobacter sp.]
MDYIYAVIIGYLCGSIPTAYWLGLAFYRLNIFEHGSKNMGATNVYRVLGKTPFAFTLAIDVLKGMSAVIITAKILGRNPLALFVAGAAALIGHTLSFWVKFRGGKGVASGLGVFMALAPRATLSALVIFMAALIISRMVSLGSILAAASLPFLIYYFQEGGPEYFQFLTVFSALVAFFIIFKHKANISRIIKGEELALGAKKKEESTEPENKDNGEEEK